MTGTCKGCGTADQEINNENKCVNCAGAMPGAGTDENDGADKTVEEGDDATSTSTST